MENLENLDVLILDIQATSPNPDSGFILEIGWLRTNALIDIDTNFNSIKSFFVKLPEGFEIPKRVQKITGITEKNNLNAKPDSEIWNLLLKDVKKISKKNKMKLCPTVIHFSKYEKPFLEDFHKRFLPDSKFPFQIICTHEISRRLFPEIPRKGLRAVAGFLGYSVPEARRCKDHVAANAFIWSEIVRILKDKYGIMDLTGLQDWLINTKTQTSKERSYPMNPECRKDLPDKPGVYRMLRSNGDVIYIGKAKFLKKRINSYFGKKAPHSEHILEMLSQAYSVDYTETYSALESAVIESDKIKKYSPPYNIALREKDRKLWFTDSSMKKISDKSGGKYQSGPFSSKELLISMNTLSNLIKQDSPKEIDGPVIQNIIGLHPDYLPDRNCFQKGLSLFFDKFGEEILYGDNYKTLLKIGKQTWLQKLEESEKSEQTDSEKEKTAEEKKDEEFEWTPERVLKFIEGNLSGLFNMIKRAQWFSLLSESVIVWENTDKKRKNVLTVKSGKCFFGRPYKYTKNINRIDFKKDNSKRLKCFNIGTYDRIRVVTTEIRRLISEGRPAKVYLSPSLVLKNEKLKKLLKWV